MTKKCDLTGVGVMTGNNVSKSKRRTKRDFQPNLKESTLKSDTLGSNVTLKITAGTLRTINKYGNLDNFLVNYGHNKLTDDAKKLKRKVEKSLKAKGEFDNVKVVTKSKVKKTASKRVTKIAKIDKATKVTKTTKVKKVAE